MKHERAVLITVNCLLYVFMLVTMLVGLNSLEWYGQVLGYGCMTVFTWGSITACLIKKRALARGALVLNVMTAVVIGSFAALHWCGFFNNFSDLDRVKDLILSTGGWAYAIYILLQLLNVVVLPLPGFLFILAGLAIFGVWETFWLTYIVFVVGAIIAFYIGRIFGRKTVVWCVGEAATAKYQEAIGNKGNLLFFMMQVLPFFPDDLLCMVAGLTKMKFWFFLMTMLIAKPLYIGAVCFLGTGTFIPFSGWGIPIWLAIFATFAVIFILFCKYQTAIENWLAHLTHGRKQEQSKGVESGDEHLSDN